MAIAGAVAATTDRPKGWNLKAARGRPVAKEKSAQALGYRVSPDDRKSITKTASASRSSIAGLIDLAVARYARDIAIADSPPDPTA